MYGQYFVLSLTPLRRHLICTDFCYGANKCYVYDLGPDTRKVPYLYLRLGYYI